MKNLEVLKIDQFEHQLPEFYANSLREHLVTSHLHISKPHRHNFYAAILFTKGVGFHDIDFNRYPVKPGSVFLLTPGQMHHWELPDDVEGYIFFHTQEFYDRHYIDAKIRDFPVFSAMQRVPVLYLSDLQCTEISGIFERLYEERAGERPMGKQLVLSLMTQAYIALSRLIFGGYSLEAEKSGPYFSKFSAFEALVERHYQVEKSPKQYARWMNVSAKHLNRINKEMVNKTTSQLITERVLLEAKRMLVYSGNSFNEIAIALGYDDYAYFSRMFKTKTGETPTDFLRKNN